MAISEGDPARFEIHAYLNMFSLGRDSFFVSTQPKDHENKGLNFILPTTTPLKINMSKEKLYSNSAIFQGTS